MKRNAIFAEKKSESWSIISQENVVGPSGSQYLEAATVQGEGTVALFGEEALIDADHGMFRQKGAAEGRLFDLLAVEPFRQLICFVHLFHLLLVFSFCPERRKRAGQN